MYISKRQAILLNLLLKSQEPMTSKTLADAVSVTSRTVKKDLKELADFVSAYGASLIAKQGIGYYLTYDTPHQKQKLIKELDLNEMAQNNVIPNGFSQRVNYIIRKLLTIDYFIKLDDLAEELFISRSTITNDMKTVKELLKRYDLTLIHRPGKGTMILGNEVAKRRCIADFFFHSGVDAKFYALDHAMFIGNHEEVTKLQKELCKVLDAYGIRMSNQSQEYLMIHIMIMIRRLTFSEYVQIDSGEAAFLQGSSAYQAACAYGHILEEYMDMTLPKAEIAYLALHFISKKMDEIPIDDARYAWLNELIGEITEMMKQVFGIDFFISDEIALFFKTHIVQMVQRYQIHLPMRNPQAAQIMTRYPYAALATAFACRIIEQRIQIKIDMHEFAYLVLYFNMILMQQRRKEKAALICGRGRPESITILNQLSEILNPLGVEVDLRDIQQINEKELSSYQMLVSTVPIRGVQIPVYYIDSYEEGLQEVRTFYQTQRYQSLRIEEYLHEELIWKDLVVENKTALIAACNLKMRQLQKKTLFHLEEIEEYRFLTFSNQCAIVLTDTLSDATFICMATLAHPLMLDQKLIQMIVMIQVRSCLEQTAERLFDFVAAWLKANHDMNQLLKHFDLETIKKSIQSFIHTKQLS